MTDVPAIFFVIGLSLVVALIVMCGGSAVFSRFVGCCLLAHADALDHFYARRKRWVSLVARQRALQAAAAREQPTKANPNQREIDFEALERSMDDR